MIEAAAICIGVAVVADAFLIALRDVGYERMRVDRRFKRRG